MINSQTKESKMKVYQRAYDNPLDKDGNKKPNKFLGSFKITKTIMEDFYAGKWVGEKDGKSYLITETEVSGMYNPGMGGSRFEVDEL